MEPAGAWKCPSCPLAYANRQGLIKHRRKKHNANDEIQNENAERKKRKKEATAAKAGVAKDKKATAKATEKCGESGSQSDCERGESGRRSRRESVATATAAT